MKGGITRIGIKEAGTLSKGDKGVLATYLRLRKMPILVCIYSMLDQDKDVYLSHVATRSSEKCALKDMFMLH